MRLSNTTCAGDEIINEYGGDVTAFVRATDAIIKGSERRSRESAEAIRRREWHRWRQMLSRCHDENHPAYARYGGRGVWVHLPWHDFETFFKEVGPPPRAGLSLDRIDVNGGYVPGNIQWATARQQARNTRATRAPVVARVVKDDVEFDVRVDVRLFRRFKTRAAADCWVAEMERLAVELGS